MSRENPMELPEFTEILVSISIYFFFNLQTGRTFFTPFNIQQKKSNSSFIYWRTNSKYKSKQHASKMWQFCLKIHFLNLGSCFVSDLTRISMLSNVNQRTSRYSNDRYTTLRKWLLHETLFSHEAKDWGCRDSFRQWYEESYPLYISKSHTSALYKTFERQRTAKFKR